MARGVNTYIFCSRGFSKSFLADLNRYLHCMFVPRHNTAITAGTNKQASTGNSHQGNCINTFEVCLATNMIIMVNRSMEEL